MATNTSRLNLRKPDTTDRVNVTTDLSDNYDKIDAGTALVGHAHSGTYVAERSAFAGRIAPLLTKIRQGQPINALIAGASIMGGFIVDGSNGTEGSYQADPNGTGRKILTTIAAKYSHPGFTITNGAIAGSGVRDWLYGGKGNALVFSLARYIGRGLTYDVVLFNVNSNDSAAPYNTTATQFEDMYRWLFKEARRFGAPIIAIAPFQHFALASYKDAFYRAASGEAVAVLPIENTLIGLTGTQTVDGTHPNATGAQTIADAAAAYFPTPTENVFPTAPPVPWGVYTDPAVRGTFYAWAGDDGSDRLYYSRPLSDVDGFTSGTTLVYPPPPKLSALMLRNSVFLTDCVQDATLGAQYLKNLTGLGFHGLLGTTSGVDGTEPTWKSGGGLTFDGTKFARIPMDTLNRLKLALGRDTMTIRIVVKSTSVGAATIIGRRGPAPDAPFGFLVGTTGTDASMFRDTITMSGGPTSPTNAVNIQSGQVDMKVGAHVVTISIRGGYTSGLVDQTKARGHVFIDGAWKFDFDVPITDPTGDSTDFTLGGRWATTNMSSIAAQWSGEIHWVDIARCYIPSSSIEDADQYAVIKAKLNAERSLALP